MISDIKISVVIPCYNAEDTILICLQSIINQSQSVNEIIIVDDESTDGTVGLLKSKLVNVALQVKVVLHEQKNQGPSVARNKGVSLATSNYIAFLDSDDQWSLDHILLAKTFLTENPSYNFIASKYQSASNDYSGEVTFKMMLVKNYLSTPCVIVSKESFLACGGFNEKMSFSEDYFLWLNLVYSHKLFKLNYIGANNVINKRPFGDVGLSANLKQMHLGVLLCYKNLYHSNKIKFSTYWLLNKMESIKYLRRLGLTFLNNRK